MMTLRWLLAGSLALLCHGALAQVLTDSQVDEFIRQQRAAWKTAEDAKIAAEEARTQAQEISRQAASVRSNPEASAVDIEMAERREREAWDAVKSADDKVAETAQAARDAMFIGGPAAGFGAYTVVGRMNDPFVFCTEGIPLDGWIAVNGLSGSWMPIRKCPACPNLAWVPAFVAICPLALSMGPWVGPGKGSSFQADMSGNSPVAPFEH